MASEKFIVKYGDYTIPGRVNQFREQSDYRKFTITMDVEIRSNTTDDDGADFASKWTDALAQLSEDSQRLQVQFDATPTPVDIYDYNPADKSALKVRTNIQKPGSPLDGQFSRMLTWTCEVDLPASSGDDNYREQANWELMYSPSRRISITFSGRYTGGAGNTAFENYTAQVATWVTSVFTELSFTESEYKLKEEVINTEDDEGAFLTFRRVYQEENFPHNSAGVGALSAIRDANIKMTRVTRNVKGIPGSNEIRGNVSYSAQVDVTDATWGGWSKLPSLWKNQVKPWLVNKLGDLYGGGLKAIGGEQLSIDTIENAFFGSFEILLQQGTGGISEYNQRVELDYDEKLVPHKVMDGRAHTYIFTTHGASLMATMTTTIEKIGKKPSGPPADMGNKHEFLLLLANPGAGAWVRMQKLGSSVVEYEGQDPDGVGLPVKKYKMEFTYRYIWAVEPVLDNSRLGTVRGGSAPGGATANQSVSEEGAAQNNQGTNKTQKSGGTAPFNAVAGTDDTGKVWPGYSGNDSSPGFTTDELG